jgi:predicted adenine nucleotide alpha hydrolase (AANH) superfamily ATPase
MRLLLHACCGPCLLEPFDALAERHDVTVVYVNPNIHPPSEYRRRRDTLADYALRRGIPVVELDYDPASWARSVAGLEDDRRRRCRACFALRLGRAARYAAESGFEGLATTLTVSPYQDAEAIRDAGVAACAVAGIEWVHADFRDRYPEATRRSRELGMYRQNYCGCVLSAVEAERERAARKEARKAEKAEGRRTGAVERLERRKP